MTPAEVAYRAVRAIQARAERSGIARERDVPAPDLAVQPNPWIHANAQRRIRRVYVEAAERIAHGWLDVFALRDVNLGHAAALEPRPEDRHRGAARCSASCSTTATRTWSATSSTCGSRTATCTW